MKFAILAATLLMTTPALAQKVGDHIQVGDTDIMVKSTKTDKSLVTVNLYAKGTSGRVIPITLISPDGEVYEPTTRVHSVPTPTEGTTAIGTPLTDIELTFTVSPGDLSRSNWTLKIGDDSSAVGIFLK